MELLTKTTRGNMGAKKGNPGGTTSIQTLTPEARVVIIDGHELRVAGNASENDFMSKVMSCQIRKVFQDGLKRYSDEDVKFAPKELKDLVDAARGIVELCGLAYSKDEMPAQMRKAQSDADPADSIDFSKLAAKPEPQPENASTGLPPDTQAAGR